MNKINRAAELDLANGRDWLQAAESAYSKGDIDQARAAAMIGCGYVQLAHTSQALTSMAETSQVRQAILSLSDEPETTLAEAIERERRAAAEARPHDDETEWVSVAEVRGFLSTIMSTEKARGAAEFLDREYRLVAREVANRG